VADAEQALERFAERWDAKYPTISPSWLADWERLTVLFDYPPAIRRVIYTPNACESLNSTLRKRLKTRGVFPNDEAISKVLDLALQNVAKKWTRPIRDWKAALNQFVSLFGERVPV
jgi:transposase-like protein